MENGYHLYDFKGEQLREEPIEKFKQWAWRPRPPTLLSSAEKKTVRKNLRDYSRVFEQEDQERIAGADQEVVDRRRRVLMEWYQWREAVEAEVAEDREAMGIPEDVVSEMLQRKTEELATGEEEKVIEEIVEEVLEENEEIVQ
jgi:translation initiation factor 3 subunit B